MRRLSPPRAWPISLAEAKSHLRATAHDADDADIDRLIREATEHVERATNRQLVAATWRKAWDSFPGPTIHLPRSPLAEIELFQYRDSTGEWADVDASLYHVDADDMPGTIRLEPGRCWPTPALRRNAVELTWHAGIAAPWTASDDTLTILGRSLVDGETVTLRTSGTLPAPLVADRRYLIADGDADSLDCTLTDLAGNPISLTDAGTGVHWISTDFRDWDIACRAILLLIGHWFENREESISGTIIASIPRGAAALIQQMDVGDEFTRYE